mmetsp:Transcript_32833/g.65087  ORF Transcript_32833/g.65087 Transcript_32833/m.65087 type:complete len:243 (+) Transcript_32833:109-837(+)
MGWWGHRGDHGHELLLLLQLLLLFDRSDDVMLDGPPRVLFDDVVRLSGERREPEDVRHPRVREGVHVAEMLVHGPRDTSRGDHAGVAVSPRHPLQVLVRGGGGVPRVPAAVEVVLGRRPDVVVRPQGGVMRRVVLVVSVRPRVRPRRRERDVREGGRQRHAVGGHPERLFHGPEGAAAPPEMRALVHGPAARIGEEIQTQVLVHGGRSDTRSVRGAGPRLCLEVRGASPSVGGGRRRGEIWK